MKKIGMIIGIIISIAALCAISYFVGIKIETNKVNNQINSFFEQLKSDEDNAQREEIFKSDDDEENSGIIINSNVLFYNLEYKINSEDVDFQKATVNLSVTNKNMKTVITNYYIKAFQLAFANAFSNSYSEEEISQMLEEYLETQINSEEIENITTDISVTLLKENGEWSFEEESLNELEKALLPGAEEASNILNSNQDEE